MTTNPQSPNPNGELVSNEPPAPNRRFALLVWYDGTHYQGWQKQGGEQEGFVSTVQGHVGEALSDLAGQPIRLAGAGRTDKGVHALGQVAVFEAPFRYGPREVLRALNARLPDDIQVAGVGEAPEEFHPRYSATSKTYFYQIHFGPIMPPHRRRYFLHERRSLELNAMRRAADALVGRFDFRAFAAGCRTREDTVRTVYGIRFQRLSRGLRIFVTGEGFLYKMVRSIVGTLLAVGRGELGATEVSSHLASGDRSLLPATAPAHGLVLWRVLYDLAPHERNHTPFKGDGRILPKGPTARPFFRRHKTLEGLLAGSFSLG